MRILVTNDDGIHAAGLAVLESIARKLTEDVYVVAPEMDQSGVSHSLSLNDPLRLRRIDDRHFAVKGTPTDCVIMGLRHILKGMKVDLVLSGVNRGQNVAEDVTYSGTVAAAMEGTILGVPAIALSQAYPFATRAQPDYGCALHHGPGILRKLLKVGMAPGILLNVNFPARAPQEVTGIAVVHQGQRNMDLLQVEPRHDGRGNPYFWLAFGRGRVEPADGTDLQALAEGRIAITPLRLDLTDLPSVTRLTKALDA